MGKGKAVSELQGVPRCITQAAVLAVPTCHQALQHLTTCSAAETGT